MKRNTVISLALVAVLVGGGFVYTNGVRNNLIGQETALSAAYRDNQNELSSYVTAFYEQVGIADRKSDQLDRVITDAVKGRYEGNTSAQPGGGSLFSAIAEAYPEVDLSTYDRIVDFIEKSRNQFKNKQSRLLNMVAGYENSRKQGFLNSAVANMLGFPSDSLQARVNGNVFYGRTALEQIQQIVLDDTTNKAFDDGKMAPLTPPPLNNNNNK